MRNIKTKNSKHYTIDERGTRPDGFSIYIVLIRLRFRLCEASKNILHSRARADFSSNKSLKSVSVKTISV